MRLLQALRRRAPEPPLAAPEPVVFAARTHVGTVRSLNEDRYVALPERGLWAVADGMGGHRAGDVAAQMVVDALRAIPGDVSAAAVSAAVQSVNASLLSRGGAPRDVSGSTLVAVILRGDQYSCLWAGDSQAWLFRGGAGLKITRDHSLVQELIDAGAMSAADRRRHPHAHVITRAVGTGDPLLLDKVEGDLRSGDTLLLCSDGLSDVLEPPRLAELTARADLDSAADALLAEALERSASDNVTFLLIRLTAP